MKELALGLVVALAGCLLPEVAIAASAPHMCFGRPATIIGTAGADKIQGTQHSDVIVGLGGGDVIDGKGGADLICLRAGKTPASGPTSGFEVARGGDGRDRISGGKGPDCVYGDDGNDLLMVGPSGHSVLRGTDDCAAGGAGRDALIGSRGEDGLNGGPGEDVLRGGGWFDSLIGGPGDDRINGGAAGPLGDFVDYRSTGYSVKVNLSSGHASGDGKDLLKSIENIVGSNHGDRLTGSVRDNLMYAGHGDDTLEGRGGDDCLFPNLGTNSVEGGRGYDYFTGDALTTCRKSSYVGSDISFNGGAVTVDLRVGTATRGMDENDSLEDIEGVFGTTSGDSLTGDSHANKLYGGAGNDDLHGMAGDDLLDGSTQTDMGDGGDGDDRCVDVEVEVACEPSL